MPRYPGIHGLSTINAIGILSSFSRRAARLNISHCSGSMAVSIYRGQYGISTGRPSAGSAQRSLGTVGAQPGRADLGSFKYFPLFWQHGSLYLSRSIWNLHRTAVGRVGPAVVGNRRRPAGARRVLVIRVAARSEERGV